MTEPMSDEQLTIIRERWVWPLVRDDMVKPRRAVRDVQTLLAEVARLRAALEREHEDRTREYDYAGADAETAAKRIRELYGKNMALRGKLEREEAENAAMREIVRQVVTQYADDGHTGAIACKWCGIWLKNDHESLDDEHTADCLVTKAQALDI